MEHADDFDAFYAATYTRLVGQLYAVTGDLAEAEDVVQEAFARAVVRWPRIRGYDLPEAWVRRVAVNLARQGLRRTRRRLRLLVRLAPPPPAPGPSVDGLVLAAALRTLPPAQRQVLALHHAAGLPVREVAELLGVPEGTAKARLARGRAALAALLVDPQEVDLGDR
jgi:RNA polymerase sigma-70 factor (ECF subfamily)